MLPILIQLTNKLCLIVALEKLKQKTLVQKKKAKKQKDTKKRNFSTTLLFLNFILNIYKLGK